MNGDPMRAFAIGVLATACGGSLPDAPQNAEHLEQAAPKPAPDNPIGEAAVPAPARAAAEARTAPAPAEEPRAMAPTTGKQVKVEVARPVAPATSTAKALAPEPAKKEAATATRAAAKTPAAAPEPSETRMYLCRDGTASPTCVCGGPKRGCCSRHGGVAGCE